MSNTTNNLPSVFGGLKQNLQRVKQALPAASTEPLLRLGKDGIWVFGQSNESVEFGSKWAVDPLTIKHGFTCWTNRQPGEGKNELLGEVFAPMASDPVNTDKLPDHSPWQWKPAASVTLRCLDGKDRGTQVLYKTPSVGGLKAISKLCDSLEAQIDTGSDEVVPVVDLRSGHYQHNQFGKTYTPDLHVTGWLPWSDKLPTPDATDAPEEAGATSDEPVRQRQRIAA